jgi:hypothetical protein
MSPEQATGQNQQLTTVTDVRLGVVLYEPLTGRLLKARLRCKPCIEVAENAGTAQGRKPNWTPTERFV